MARSLRTWSLIAVIACAFSFGFSDPSPQGLVHPVNMTFDGDRLFVSDRWTGVHVFDVTDPAAPALTMRIPLKGNDGTAVKDDILYASSYGSILAIRIKGTMYDVVDTLHYEPRYADSGFDDVVELPDAGFHCACSVNTMPADSRPVPASTGSSFATFAVIGDYLYYVDNLALITVNVSQPDKPKKLSRTTIGWDIETLYPTEEYLFVGGTRGMYIFDRSDPASPEPIGELQHFRACDPVVVSNDVAYVTLRGGNQCGANEDLLLCVDISDPSKPVLLGEKSIETPYGLAIEDPLLYVSTGDHGFELFDVTKPVEPSRVKSWSDRPTKDFIWANHILYTLTFEGLLIFDVTKPEEPVLLSEIGSKPN
jgi:hypothetical protein